MPARNAPILIRLLALSRPYTGLLLITLLMVVGSTLMVVATPVLIAYAIDFGFDISREGVVLGDMHTLLIAAALLGAAAIGRSVFVYFQTYLAERVSQSIAYDLRNSIYDHLQRLSYAYHDDVEIGQVMSKATQDVEAVRFFVSMGVIRLIYIVALVGVFAVYMLSVNVLVALFALAFIPIVAGQAIYTARYMRPLWLAIHDRMGYLGNVLQENLTGQRVVKAFSREEFEQEKFDAEAQQLFEDNYRASRFSSWNEPAMQSIWLVALAVVFWVGGREVIAGRMEIGDLIAFQISLTLLQVPVRSLGFIVGAIARADSAGTRIAEILDARSAVQNAPDAQPLRVGRGEVRFDEVSFGYEAASPVLERVDIEARPGEVIALLGPTGSGKSTVVNLLPRFYDVTAGAITIDGQNIRDVTIESLREAIGIVQQDVFLFAATIRENIAYGRPDATEDEIIEASRAARLHEFISSLPDGYETWVGERGVTLSGGQKQRVAIARTLLLNPRILVLDDSTSSVDMRTEYLIQEALAALMRGRTTFVIAQRLRTVQQADQILIMDGGRIVERGTHEELLAAGGHYRTIYDLELRDQEESGATVDEAAAASSTASSSTRGGA